MDVPERLCKLRCQFNFVSEILVKLVGEGGGAVGIPSTVLSNLCNLYFSLVTSQWPVCLQLATAWLLFSSVLV